MTTETDLAEAVTEALFARDHAAQSLGIAIEAAGPGHARLSMRVRDDMLNSFGVCHAGFISALADSAAGYAANSHNLNATTGSSQIEFLAPVEPGDRLVATAWESLVSGRRALHDVRVTNQRDEVVASSRHRSVLMGGQVLGEMKAGD